MSRDTNDCTAMWSLNKSICFLSSYGAHIHRCCRHHAGFQKLGFVSPGVRCRWYGEQARGGRRRRGATTAPQAARTWATPGKRASSPTTPWAWRRSSAASAFCGAASMKSVHTRGVHSHRELRRRSRDVGEQFHAVCVTLSFAGLFLAWCYGKSLWNDLP